MLFRKTLAALLIAAGIAFFPSNSGDARAKKEDYPTYPNMGPKQYYESNKKQNIEEVIGVCETDNITEVEQRLYVNIPGFYVRLENRRKGELCSVFRYDIRTGRHWENHTDYRKDDKVSLEMETPIGNGYIINKKFGMVFKYFEDVYKDIYRYYFVEKRVGKKIINVRKKELLGRKLVHRKGEIIKESNTFTKNGEHIRIPMPYDWIRGFGMLIESEQEGREVGGCIFHATTDWYTVGTPASHCCIGLSLDDMLDLYGMVAPEQRKGGLIKRNKRGKIIDDRRIPITIDYRLVEVEKKGNGMENGEKWDYIVLHADVYEKGGDYKKMIMDEMKLIGYAAENIDEARIDEIVKIAQEQFKRAYKEIREMLRRGRFVNDELKQGLHYRVRANYLKQQNSIHLE